MDGRAGGDGGTAPDEEEPERPERHIESMSDRAALKAFTAAAGAPEPSAAAGAQSSALAPCPVVQAHWPR